LQLLGGSNCAGVTFLTIWITSPKSKKNYHLLLSLKTLSISNVFKWPAQKATGDEKSLMPVEDAYFPLRCLLSYP